MLCTRPWLQQQHTERKRRVSSYAVPAFHVSQELPGDSPLHPGKHAPPFLQYIFWIGRPPFTVNQ